ncbi:hypothetical protein OPV22_024284 [Ensete ventricosum]|uniref:C2 domain-containing protein n=1 Tax=Ensete ventricosum TaxID=4639 RepID=A0AAV8QUQ7_ENSVE|nr:hypothetical protein OPV22_024284 [Ensete ventricosum]RWW07674.1 hypothetical protein GW17_00028935 [Ensete ventricosum]
MSNCSELSHLRCEIKVDRLSNFYLDLPGNLSIRYFVVAGSGRRIRVDTREVPATSNPRWAETATIECQGAADPVGELLQPHKVVFELRWRRRGGASFLGGFAGTKLLGRAEVAWKEVVASPDVASKRCVRFAAVSSELCGLEPPSLSVEMKAEVTEAPKMQRIGRSLAMEERGCRSRDWAASEEEIVLAAATLNAW